MILETNRLILRNFKESDIEDYWEYVQMPNVGPRAGWPAYTDKNEAIKRLKLESEKENQFAIVYKQNNKVIGSIELMDFTPERYSNLVAEDNAKEIGFILSEHYWGKGIMVEATKKILEYAFEFLNVENIYISHAKANTNSMRVQEKIGFKVIGEVENFRTWVDGTQTSLIERKMTKQEYLNIKETF